MDPRGSPPWFGAITVRSNFGRNRWPWGSRKFEFWGMVIFYGFDPFFSQWDPIGPKMDPRGSPSWFGAIIVRSNFGRNRWARGSRKIRILGQSNFLRFWPIFWPQWDPIGPKMDPTGSPPWIGAITLRSNFGRNRWPRGSRKFEFWGIVIFYGFDPFLGPNGTPLATRWARGSRKFEFWGMVIFYGFDPFLGPNGTPLATRWTLGGPHRDLAP